MLAVPVPEKAEIGGSFASLNKVVGNFKTPEKEQEKERKKK